ncbi:TniQ family protein [Lysinibacillus xylanilyticus]|uniref:TniQ family protein n=1 Tax=Lysinibacillus xylanilyticus TaxID=582475 RepID=UPI003D00B0FB
MYSHHYSTESSGLKERNATVKRKMDLNRYSLKFCPHCVRDDIEKYGESYWKISHQLPTAFFV